MPIPNRELSQFGSFLFVNNTSRNIGIATSSTPYVGIGTTNPQYKLHVSGDTNIDGNVYADAFYDSLNQPLVAFDTWAPSGSNIYRLSGNVGIGTSVVTSKLTIKGDVSVSGVITCTDLNSTSDINLKTNIKTIENSLDILSQLRGVSFEWKENHKPSYGVIAQELEEILPQLVNDGEHKSVNYNGLIGVLIESVKELKKEIKELKKQLNK